MNESNTRHSNTDLLFEPLFNQNRSKKEISNFFNTFSLVNKNFFQRAQQKTSYLKCKTTITDKELRKLLDQFPNLIELDLFGCTSLRDFSFLIDLTNLKHLNLSFCHLDASEINLPAQLKGLELRDAGIENLDFLPLQLQTLGLVKCTSLKDVSFLSKLTQLKNFGLLGCPSFAYNIISSLPQLEKLKLDACFIKDLTFLSQLQSLFFWNIKRGLLVREPDKVPIILPLQLKRIGVVIYSKKLVLLQSFV